MKFTIDQKIMFEITDTRPKDGGTWPRWWWNEDQGGTGNWATGNVKTIDYAQITVSYDIFGYIGTGECCFPNVGHKTYVPEQWNYEGYLQSGECDCGSKAIKCGSHSHWCTENVFNRRKDGV